MRRITVPILVIAFLLSANPTPAELPELLGVLQDSVNGTLYGMELEPMGDQNNDGYDDFIVHNGYASLLFYFGGTTVDTVEGFRLDSLGNLFRNIGDVNGDGFDDLAVRGRNNELWRFNMFYGGPGIDTISDRWFGFDTLQPFRNCVLGNDINGNGTNEIIVQATEQDCALLCELTSDGDSIPDLILRPPNLGPLDYVSFGDGLISGDFNGDDLTDIAIGLRRRDQQTIKGSVYLYWGGPGFDTIPDMIINRPGEYVVGCQYFGWKLVSLGDFNADGYEDFYAGVGVVFDDTLNYIFFGGPDIDTVPDITIVTHHSVANRAGDINNDGYPDLAVSLPLPWSGMGHVSVLFGGPDADSVPDVVITNSEFPDYQTEFGRDCSGIGDFNGDGVDDLAFSAMHYSRATVYLISGKSIATDVSGRPANDLPDEFHISQNYPNPFNSGTTFEFNLPMRGYVTVTVHNILGREVARLVDREMPAGTHIVRWDGRSAANKEVASGIYLYRFSAGTATAVRKMVLVK